MKTWLLIVLIIFSAGLLPAQLVERYTADAVTEKLLNSLPGGEGYQVKEDALFIDNSFFLYKLEPHGFVIVAGDYRLRPVIGYSLHNGFTTVPEQKELIFSAIGRYTANTLSYQDYSEAIINRERWSQVSFRDDDFQQWPPQGTTPTGGWLATNWQQESPYNAMCPLDPANNNRSLAGCPSIAMAQIVNYHRVLNQTRFADNDRYRMFYSGVGDYYIDDAAAQLDFPDFETLNGYLDTIEDVYNNSEDQLSNDLRAALVFASGVAIKQAYSSGASGNYFDVQIIEAYHRFGFHTAELLNEYSPMLSERIFQNMKQGLPAQLSLLMSNGGGHQVVVDGYNTNDEIHLNFGWGGQANGWYAFPVSNMPYQLNIFGTVFLDIGQDYEDLPDFDLLLTNNDDPVNGNILQYQITNGCTSLEEFVVYLNDDLIDVLYSEGTYSLLLHGFDNGYHDLKVFGINEERKHRLKQIRFEIGRGELIFAEDFEPDWVNNWTIDSSAADYTWQPIENSFLPFSYYNPESESSATCPVAYGNLNEKMTSQPVFLPASSDLSLSFYAAYSDMYLNYPNLNLKGSRNHGNTWEDIWTANTPGLDWRWHRVAVDITSFAGEEVIFRFTANGFSYSDVSLDHLRIYDQSNVGAETVSLPKITGFSVYPNPVRGSDNTERSPMTNIDFALETSGMVCIDLFDIRGRRVETILDEFLPAGRHNISWQGFNSKGRFSASGVYFIRIKTESSQRVKKILLLR
jgi:hypothetical protein